jgi:hypothetical protein
MASLRETLGLSGASANMIIADFVGYDAPDHFFGPRTALRTVMTGRAGVATSPGKRGVADRSLGSPQHVYPSS